MKTQTTNLFVYITRLRLNIEKDGLNILDLLTVDQKNEIHNILIFVNPDRFYQSIYLYLPKQN